MAVGRHLGLCWEDMVPPTMPHLWCVPPVKFYHDWLSSFQVRNIYLLSFRLERIYVAKISHFWGAT